MIRNFWKLSFLAVLICEVFVLAGCLNEQGGDDSNKIPLAKLSVEAKGELVAGNPVVLNGSLSSDPDDGDSIEYDFKVIAEEEEIFHSTNSDNPIYCFIPQKDGNYSATLTVTDKDGNKAQHTIQFTIVELEISEIFPSANEDNVPVNINQLKWNCNGCSDTKFKVYFSASDTSPQLATDADGISEKCFFIGALPYDTVCSWRIVAENNGYIRDTGIMKFHTAEGNSPPIVHIIPSKTKYAAGDMVRLTSQVDDADDDVFTYAWEFLKVPSGSLGFEFDAPFDANTNFQTDANGVYEVKLTVLDAKGGEGSAEISIDVEEIRISNLNPVPDSVNQPLALTISWNCNVEDASFKIKFGKCAGFSENAEIYDLGKNKFFTPAKLESNETYCVQIIARNNDVERILPINHSEWRFTVANGNDNHPPIANAGPDQFLILGQVIIFDASESSDQDGDPLSFYWKVITPKGDELSIDDPNQEIIWFFGEEQGIYTGTITISDGATQSIDTVEASVSAPINQKPIADIRSAKTEIMVGENLSLDGSYSYDPEGEVMTYKWKLDGAGELYNTDSAYALFIGNTPGVNTISLIVNDGQLDSNSVLIEVIVTESVEELYLREFNLNSDLNVPPDGNLTWESNGEVFDVFFSFDDGVNFQLVANFQAEKSFSLEQLNLENGKMYYYNVVAYKGEKHLISDVMNFKTAEEIPALFISITNPDDKAKDVPVNVCLSWAGNGDAYKIFMKLEGHQDYTEIDSISEKEYCLNGDNVLAGETTYFLKVVATRGDESVQEEILFTTAPFSIIEEWKGTDVTLTANGILEIRNYNKYLTNVGREAIGAGAVVVLEGDITLWNIAGALSSPCSLTGGVLKIDLNKAPFLVNYNSFSVNLAKDGQRIAFSQFHLLDVADRDIILRKREGTQDWALAFDMQVEGDKKIFSPCPKGEVPIRMAH